MIRALINRDGPGCWSYAIFDADSTELIVSGDAATWPEARDAAVGELRIFAAPPEPPLVSPAAADRSWLTRLLLGPER